MEHILLQWLHYRNDVLHVTLLDPPKTGRPRRKTRQKPADPVAKPAKNRQTLSGMKSQVMEIIRLLAQEIPS
jgi:hypothetical protein